MYDSSGKFPDGVIEGNWNVLGSYDSCYEIEVDDFYDFGGKFCYLRFQWQVKNYTVNSRGLFPLLGPLHVRLSY